MPPGNLENTLGVYTDQVRVQAALRLHVIDHCPAQGGEISRQERIPRALGHLT